MLKKIFVFNLVFFGLLAFLSCSNGKDDEIVQEPPVQNWKPQDIEAMKSYLVSNYGFSADSIKVFQEKGVFIVERCMLFEMEDFWGKYARNRVKLPTVDFNSSAHAQRVASDIYAQTFTKEGSIINSNIRVILLNVPTDPIYDRVPDAWLEAIIFAAEEWNKLNGRFRFTINRSDRYDAKINIFYQSWNGKSPDSVAHTPFPFYGFPSPRIIINSSYVGSLSPEDRIRAICHEIGHALGFGHTDSLESDVIQLIIPGCGTGDGCSVMWSSLKRGCSPMFSECDKEAYRRIYYVR